jgi:hypothetical protein
MCSLFVLVVDRKRAGVKDRERDRRLQRSFSATVLSHAFKHDARNRENQTPAQAEVETQVVSQFAILATMTAQAFRSAGRFSPLRPLGIVPISVSAQHALKKTDLLSDYVDSLISCQRLGDRSAGINRF